MQMQDGGYLIDDDGKQPPCPICKLTNPHTPGEFWCQICANENWYDERGL